MKNLFVALLFLSGLFVNARTNPDLDQVHSAMHLVTIIGFSGEEECTGYAIARYALFIAGHCLKPTPTDGPMDNVYAFDSSFAMATPVEAILDDHDHAIVILKPVSRVHWDGFKTWIVPKFVTPDPGDRVYTWGNPRTLFDATDCYREGYFSGSGRREVQSFDSTRDSPKFEYQAVRLFVLATAFGDSGSLIFNAKGEIVGQVSYVTTTGMTISVDFAFTPEQLQKVGK